MKSINFSLLASQKIADTLGKRGTQSDITLYDRKEHDTIRTWVRPHGFPEKIQPLLQAINLGEYAIICLDTLDRFAGEQILALDLVGIKDGILSHTHDVDHDSLLRAISGTVLEDYRYVEPDNIRLASMAFEPLNSTGDTNIVVDHCFDVKGAGTIILGKVVSGSVSKYDNLTLYPTDVPILVKSIQMHDDPVDKASSPARVGLAVKGVKPDDVRRGDMMCNYRCPVTSTLDIDFTKTPYYDGDITEGQMCLVSMGLQTVSGRFVSTNPVSIRTDRPVSSGVYNNCIILKPEHKIRIMGGGSISN